LSGEEDDGGRRVRDVRVRLDRQTRRPQSRVTANLRSGDTLIVTIATTAIANRIAITTVDGAELLPALVLPVFAMKLNAAISAMCMMNPTACDAPTALTAGPVAMPCFCR
jgi:hypothetical protein